VELRFKAWLERTEKATKDLSADKRRRLDKVRDLRPSGNTTPDTLDWSPTGVSNKLWR